MRLARKLLVVTALPARAPLRSTRRRATKVPVPLGLSRHLKPRKECTLYELSTCCMCTHECLQAQAGTCVLGIRGGNEISDLDFDTVWVTLINMCENFAGYTLLSRKIDARSSSCGNQPVFTIPFAILTVKSIGVLRNCLHKQTPKLGTNPQHLFTHTISASSMTTTRFLWWKSGNSAWASHYY